MIDTTEKRFRSVNSAEQGEYSSDSDDDDYENRPHFFEEMMEQFDVDSPTDNQIWVMQNMAITGYYDKYLLSLEPKTDRKKKPKVSHKKLAAKSL